MADQIHLFQWLAAFVGALWLTERWLLHDPGQRWRHIIAGICSTILWIPVAYTANNVAINDSGVTAVFGSQALASFAIFMVLVNIIGLVLGLYLWVEGETDAASDYLPRELQRSRGD